MIATNIQFMKNAEFRTPIKQLNICITTFMPHNCNKNNWITHERGTTIFAPTSEYNIGSN